MTFLSAMADVESSVQRHFTQNVLKVIFVCVTGVRHIARTPSVCIYDGHDDSSGTVQRDNTRAN